MTILPLDHNDSDQEWVEPRGDRKKQRGFIKKMRHCFRMGRDYDDVIEVMFSSREPDVLEIRSRNKRLIILAHSANLFQVRLEEE